ncbi:MAG: MAPEG family protein [Gammaproteobacteria bacterium]|nr:MAPEG family protein [Gammaproteobacteria bacterium]
MTIALWTLLLAALMPIVCAGIAKVGPGRYDNRNPRDWQAKQQGYRARAYAAQQNCWEALAVYVAALVAAFIGNVPLETLALIAGIFAASRVAYLACYLADLATLRSLVWLVGFGSCICLIVMGAQAI